MSYKPGCMCDDCVAVRCWAQSQFGNGPEWPEADRYMMNVYPPRYPVPAICNHLNLIAAEPMLAWEDFKAIGYHGKR